MDLYNKKEDDGSTTKGGWNAAQDTLQRLSELIKLYRQLSIGIMGNVIMNPETPENQKRIHRTAKMFMVEAAPLLSTAQDKEAHELFKHIPLCLERKNGVIHYAYDPSMLSKLDDFLVFIENCLQAKGYFMPEGEDDGL